ncbi:MAG: hypothetical protein ACT4PX_04895 [Actinomycetota bacterium]
MNSAHLDDEQLSASLDGEGGPAGAAHLAGCEACTRRRAELDAVRRAVAAPGPGAAAGVADRAVGAALAAWAAERASTSPGSPPLPTTGDGAATRASSAASGDTPAEVIPLRRRRVPAWALGAAAAVAALLVAVPVLTRDGGGDVEQTAGSVAGDEATSAEATGPVIYGGDLGPQDDQLALGRILESALAGAGAQDRTMAAPAAEADQAAPTAGGGPAPAPSAAASTAGAVPSSSEPVCAGTVRSSYDRGLGPLVYRATVTWQGTPSELLAYRLADTAAAGPDHRVFVMAVEGCRLLVVQGF